VSFTTEPYPILSNHFRTSSRTRTLYNYFNTSFWTTSRIFLSTLHTNIRTILLTDKMSYFIGSAARYGESGSRAVIAAATDRRSQDSIVIGAATDGRRGAAAVVASHGRSRDGAPVTRVDTFEAELSTTPSGRPTIGFKLTTFIEDPIPYVDPRDGHRYHVPGSVRMINYHAGNFSYDDHNMGPVRQVHPRLALEDQRRENDRGRANDYDHAPRPAPRRSRSRDYHTVRTSHSTRTIKKPSPEKPKAPLVPVPDKGNTKGTPLWDDSAHDAWKCANWEDFAIEAAAKERETLHDSMERPWAHEAWGKPELDDTWEELAMEAVYKERAIARGEIEGPREAPLELKAPDKKSKVWN